MDINGLWKPKQIQILDEKKIEKFRNQKYNLFVGVSLSQSKHLLNKLNISGKYLGDKIYKKIATLNVIGPFCSVLRKLVKTCLISGLTSP